MKYGARFRIPMVSASRVTEVEKYLITTRPEEKVSEMPGSLCFDTINIPVTRLEVNTEFEPGIITEFEPSIAIFTSTYGASAFLERWPGTLASGTKVLAIGNATAEVLKGTFPDVAVPEERSSAGIISLLGRIVRPGERVVLFVSSRTNGVIERFLRENEVEYLSEELYYSEELPAEEFYSSATDPDCFGIIVTSSYEARVIFEELLDKDEINEMLMGRKIFSIGKTTSKTLMELGIPVSEPYGESSLEELIEGIDRMYCPGE